jgi:lipoyl(octanoyl) transferase
MSDAPLQAMSGTNAPEPVVGHAIVVRRLGCTDYHDTWHAMQSFTDARRQATADEIWLTEHPPVYTLGLAGRTGHVHGGRDAGGGADGGAGGGAGARGGAAIPVHKVDRGGQVTYHGPGQLVAYTLVDLARARLGVRMMVRALEAAIVEWLASHGVTAYGKPSAPGVYVARGGCEAKIAALGLKVRRGCTYHGIAVNVDMDLTPFSHIDPCGYPGLAVTQLADFGVRRTVAQAGEELAPVIARQLRATA